jgi:hypothetical protein
LRTTSQFISTGVDNFLLELEYNSKIISTRDVSFLRLKNLFAGSINYLSYNPEDYNKAQLLTGNILDVTAQPISDTEFVHFDTDRPIRYFEQRNDIIFESLWHDISEEIFVTYNTLRIHVLSGYTFSDIAGLISRIAYVDNNFNQVFVANIAYLKEDTINFNSKPLRLVDKIYDRYIEFRFPSILIIKVLFQIYLIQKLILFYMKLIIIQLIHKVN